MPHGKRRAVPNDAPVDGAVGMRLRYDSRMRREAAGSSARFPAAPRMRATGRRARMPEHPTQR
jgi:hypothetical protein